MAYPNAHGEHGSTSEPTEDTWYYGKEWSTEQIDQLPEPSGCEYLSKWRLSGGLCSTSGLLGDTRRRMWKQWSYFFLALDLLHPNQLCKGHQNKKNLNKNK